MSNPDYIQASCVSGAQILVHINGIISYDAGHNYRRWTLQASPTVFNTHTEKYVYVAIPRDMDSSMSAFVVFPSEKIDIYGINDFGVQIGSTDYYYIFLQGIISSSGENGTTPRDWKPDNPVNFGLLASDEAIKSTGTESEWYKYSAVDETTTFLKNLTMKVGTWFKNLFAENIKIRDGGKILFEHDNNELIGVADNKTLITSEQEIVTPKYMDDHSLSSDHDDVALGKIAFNDGISVGDQWYFTKDGYAKMLSMLVQCIKNSSFRNGGLTGEGFRLWIDEGGLASLELDKITVRQIMTVFELIIDRVRSIGGQFVVSAANGKVKEVEDIDETYKLTFEGDNYFQVHDLIRCQVFTGNDIRMYWVEVSAIGANYVVINKSEFADGVFPKAGDEVVLIGNTVDVNRQNLISISATNDGEPRIDVLDGVSSKNFNHALRARIGNLNGITDEYFPLDNQPHGNGLYADNVYLRGSFLLSTGEDVKTKFDVVEGKINTAIDGLRQELSDDKSYLDDPTFSNGMEKWLTQNDAVFFLVGNKWVWTNNAPLSKKGDGATVVTDMGRTTVHIINRYIMQRNRDFHHLPEFPTDNDGKKQAIPVYLSFYYRCAKEGTLRISFENVDKTGFADFDSMDVTETIAVTEGYTQFTCNGLWNGTGDFKLSFDGEIYLYMLVLSTDKVEALAYKYKTLFEQSEQLVKIAAQNFDKDGHVLNESGIMVRAEGAGIYTQDADGNLATVGTFENGVVKLTGNEIQLEGDVTANGRFHISTDGSVTMTDATMNNAHVSGYVQATTGYVGDFQICGSYIGVESSTENDGMGLGQDYLLLRKTQNSMVYFQTGGDVVQTICNTVAKLAGETANTGILTSVSGAGRNFAMRGTGSVCQNGAVEGYALRMIEVPDGTNVVINPAGAFCFYVTFLGTGRIVLPKLSSARLALGIEATDNTPFQMCLTFIFSSDSGMGNYLLGRSADFNTDEYPSLFGLSDGLFAVPAVYSSGVTKQRYQVQVRLVYTGAAYLAYLTNLYTM